MQEIAISSYIYINITELNNSKAIGVSVKFYGLKYYKKHKCAKLLHIESYSAKMNSSLRSLQVLLLVATATVYTGAIMVCKKSTGTINDIMEMGRYMVKTTHRTDSTKLQDLISLLTLHEASDIQYKRKSFIAVLQPRDLKKVFQIYIAIYYIIT